MKSELSFNVFWPAMITFGYLGTMLMVGTESSIIIFLAAFIAWFFVVSNILTTIMIIVGAWLIYKHNNIHGIEKPEQNTLTPKAYISYPKTYISYIMVTFFCIALYGVGHITSSGMLFVSFIALNLSVLAFKETVNHVEENQ